ncbi:MAG: diacylglycerol kinase family protein [Pseudomonadota bacterium]
MIGNPAAGYGFNKTRIYGLVRILEDRGYEVKTHVTASPGDARRMACQIGQDEAILLVAGGDGTLNEVINGLNDPSRIPLLLFPMGTSNSMAKELGLSKRLDSVANTLEQGMIRRVDMGRVSERRFLLFVSAGLDAMVTREVLRRGRTGLGYGRYIIPIIKTLASYRAPDLKVVVDGHELRGGMVLVSNTRPYGWIFRMADLARCDSGHLDICVFPGRKVSDFLRYAHAASLSRVSKIHDVHYVTGREIFIDSNEPVPVQVDGDYYGTTPIRINFYPSFVPILVPQTHRP